LLALVKPFLELFLVQLLIVLNLIQLLLNFIELLLSLKRPVHLLLLEKLISWKGLSCGG